MSQKYLLFLVKGISVIFCPPGGAGGIVNPHLISKAQNSAKISPFQSVIFFLHLRRAEYQPVVFTVDNTSVLLLCVFRQSRIKIITQIAADASGKKISCYTRMILGIFNLHSFTGALSQPAVSENTADAIGIFRRPLLRALFLRRPEG